MKKAPLDACLALSLSGRCYSKMGDLQAMVAIPNAMMLSPQLEPELVRNEGEESEFAAGEMQADGDW